MKLTVEKAISLILVMIGLVYVLEARNLPWGTLESPEEGFIPMVMGLFLIGTAIVILLRQQNFKSEKIDTNNLVRVIKLSVALIGYVLLMPFLGFKITTFLVVLSSTYILGNNRWLSNIIFGLIMTGVASYLFEDWLKLPLP